MHDHLKVFRFYNLSYIALENLEMLTSNFYIYFLLLFLLSLQLICKQMETFKIYIRVSRKLSILLDYLLSVFINLCIEICLYS